MFEYAPNMFHVGYLVPDIEAAMADLGPTMGVTWTKVIRRTDQRVWMPGYGQRTVPLTFSYSMEGPQRIELIEGPADTVWANEGTGFLHHAGVWADVPALTNDLLAKGWTLLAAQIAPEEGYGSFTYVQSPSGFILEPVAYQNKARMQAWFDGGDI